MHTQHEISALIGRIYDAAVESHRWDAFLSLLAPTFNSHMGLMTHDNFLRAEENRAYIRGFDPDRQAEFISRRDTEDYFWLGAQKMPTGSAFLGTDVIDLDTMHATSLYQELGVPMEAEYLLGANLDRQPDSLSCISLIRGANQENFSADEQQLFQLLLPHIQRAWQLNNRLFKAESGYSSAMQALEHSPHGVLLATANHQPLFINEQAEAMLLEADGITLRYGNLKFHDYANQMQFDKLAHGVTHTDEATGFTAGGIMAINRPSGKTPYQLALSPLNQNSDELQLAEHNAYLVLINDPSVSPSISTEILMHTYKLTKAEARFCKALFDTGSVEAAKDELNISIHTGRTHLSKIFVKLEVSTQAQLLKKLASGICSPGFMG